MISRIRKMSFMLFAFLYACNGNNSPSEEKQQTVQPTIESKPAAISTPKINTESKVFEQKCSSCHGSDGTAGIANAANLQNSFLERPGVIKIIKDGKGAMPSFKNQLSDEEIKILSAYVLKLRK